MPAGRARPLADPRQQVSVLPRISYGGSRRKSVARPQRHLDLGRRETVTDLNCLIANACFEGDRFWKRASPDSNNGARTAPATKPCLSCRQQGGWPRAAPGFRLRRRVGLCQPAKSNPATEQAQARGRSRIEDCFADPVNGQRAAQLEDGESAEHASQHTAADQGVAVHVAPGRAGRPSLHQKKSEAGPIKSASQN